MSNTYAVLGQKVTISSAVRSSEDALWLASSLRTKKNDHVLEVGCGNGISSLCLLTRAPHIHLYGVELNAERLEEAKINFKANVAQPLSLSLNHMDFLEDCDNLPSSFPKVFDHCFSNPPYHHTETGFQTSNAQKAQAHGTTHTQTIRWIEQMLAHTKEGGTLTILYHSQFKDVFKDKLAPYQVKVIELISACHKPAKKIILQLTKVSSPSFQHLTLNTYDAEIRKAVLEEGKSLWAYVS